MSEQSPALQTRLQKKTSVSNTVPSYQLSQAPIPTPSLLGVKGLDLANPKLLNNRKINVVLLHANGNSIEVLVQHSRVPVVGLELFHEGHSRLLHKGVVESKLSTSKTVKLSSESETRRVRKNRLAGLETETDDEDTRALSSGGAGGTAAVELLGQGGGTAAHELGGALEDRKVGVVGEEVVRVDWDTVSADTETRAERREAVRLSRGGVDHLIGVNTVGTSGVSHLVDVGNVDHAVAVLEELGHLGHLRLADGHDLVEDFAVELRDNLERLRREGAEDLGDLLGGGEGATGVYTLRRHAAVEDVLVRTEDLASGTDGDGALNDDGVTGLDVLEDHGESVDEMAKVDSVVVLEKSRDRDKVVSDSVKHGLIIGQGNLGVLGEDRLELSETIGGDVEANGLVDTAKLLEESLADETDTDDADKSLAVLSRGDLLLSKGTRKL